MTAKELRCYRSICSEIIQREEKLKRDRLHVHDAVQSAAEFPYSKHTVPIEGDVYPYPARPEFDRIWALKAKKKSIEKFVSGIQDPQLRRAMEIRYIEPCSERVTWEMVADLMADGSTGTSLKVMACRYMKKS